MWKRPSYISPKEWMLREDLACAYHVALTRKWDALIYNHITVRCPVDICHQLQQQGKKKTPPDELVDDSFFINSFGLAFDEVTPFNLLLVSCNDGRILHPGYTNMDGGLPSPTLPPPKVLLPALVIHSAIHEAFPDVSCVWHCHEPNVLAVASIQSTGFIPGLSQESIIIGPKISSQVYPFQGVVTDAKEKQSIVEAFETRDKDILLMANHGVLCCGREGVWDAFYNLHLVVKACQHQITCMTAVGGQVDALRTPDDSIVANNEERMVQQDGIHHSWGLQEWEAIKRRTMRKLMTTTLPPSLNRNPSSNKLKLLALHGFPGTIASSKDIPSPSFHFQQCMRSRGYDFDIVEPKAPNDIDGPEDGIAWLAGDQRAAGKVVGFYQRGWAGVVDTPAVETKVKAEKEKTTEPTAYTEEELLPLDLPQDNIWTGCKGFLDSLQLLEKVWLDHGGFDGVLAFSQGTLMASIFLSYLEFKNDNDGPRMQLPRFAMMAGGFARPWPIQASDYWPPKKNGGKLPIPSLHIIGNKDTVVAPCRSEELRERYSLEQGLTFKHDSIGDPYIHGGHCLPWDDSFHDKVTSFLDGIEWGES